MNTLRRHHMKMAVTYIIRQTKNKNNSLGTGGADFVSFLSKTKQETASSKINWMVNLSFRIFAKI